MPPSGKLTPAEISDLVEWVKMGAPWPEATTPSRQSSMTDPRSPAAEEVVVLSARPRPGAAQSKECLLGQITH